MTDLSSLNVPGPTIVELTAPFWDAAKRGKLLVQRCAGCRNAVFYPREICPYCWSSDLGWEETPGRGRLKSYSTVHKPSHPGWVPAVPYHVGLVELDEGPTLLSHILLQPEHLTVGVRLKLKPVEIGGRVLPAFERGDEI